MSSISLSLTEKAVLGSVLSLQASTKIVTDMDTEIMKDPRAYVEKMLSEDQD